jgi:hypothetical protein
MFFLSPLERSKKKAEQTSAAAGHKLGPWAPFMSRSAAIASCQVQGCTWQAGAQSSGLESSFPVPRCPYTLDQLAANLALPDR